MTGKIVDIIRELIVEYNYVTVPQLGGFVSNYQPAQILSEKNVILPPSKRISFNSNLNEDDGLLVTKIASAYNQSLQEAKATIEQFVQSIFKKLESGKTVSLTQIGTLKFNDELNIEFEADSNENHNPYSYGMVKTACNKLDTAIVIKEKQTVWLNRKTLIRAAVLIPFFVVGSLLSVHLHQIGFFQNSLNQMASIIDWSNESESNAQFEIQEASNNSVEEEAFTNPIEKAIEEKTDKANALDYAELAEEVIQIEEAKELAPTVSEAIVEESEPKELEFNNLEKYQLVAGSFKSEDNANRLAKKIKALNYESTVIQLGDRYRVVAASFSQKIQAQKIKKELKTKSISTWINTAK